MASLFKPSYSISTPADAQRVTHKGKPHARFKDAAGETVLAPVVTTGQGAGTRCRLKAEKWYGQYADADGIAHRVPLSENKTVAQQMLSALVKRAELGKVGISDPYEDHHKRPLAEHLDDFARFLTSKGNSAKHARMTAARAGKVVRACGFVFIRDFSPSRVQDFVANIRAAAHTLPELPGGKTTFTRAELAAVLQVKPAAIDDLVRRHGQEATGRGEERRYPRATAEAIRAALTRGVGTQTGNYYLRDVKAFCRWSVKD